MTLSRIASIFSLAAALSWGAVAEIPWNSSPNGLKWRTVVEGSGDKVEKGDLLTVHYQGWVLRGGKPADEPFDDSFLREAPLRFPLGVGEVIAGWDQGLVGMTAGEERELTVPPPLGYGDRDFGIIPPKSWLFFRVKLLERAPGLPQDTLFRHKEVEWTEVAPGVEVSDLKLGSGEKAREGDRLTLHYTGWLTGGSRFATSKLIGTPAELTLGAGQVIPGWEAGLPGMAPGGVRLMRIQPYMGYGPQAGPRIPPHSTLLFRVELLEREGGTSSDRLDLFPELASLPWNAGTEGLQTAVIEQGTGGRRAAEGDRVAVHYTGWLNDGTRFDTSRSRGEPIRITLGAGQVIPGWELGIAGMEVGEKRVLKIPAALGYGSRGAGAIPPNSELIFAVELTAIE